MGELWFVGVGLGDEKDLSRRGFSLLRTCSSIFAEEYTALWSPGAFDRLARELELPIVRLTREEVEGERRILAALDRGDRVAFLAVGDPFAATTHLALRLAAERAGHATRYLPNASILSAAAGVLGLIPYRFGRAVSLPIPEPGFAPTSPLEVIAHNRSIGVHTLVLLDLRPSEGRFLTADEALRLLIERDPAREVLPRGARVAVLARIGRPDERVRYGPVEELLHEDFGDPMHALVIPAPSLHFEEEAALRRIERPSA